jgi:hypothetical protein
MSARLAPGSWFHPSPQPAIVSWRTSASSGIFASILNARSPLLFPISGRSARLRAFRRSPCPAPMAVTSPKGLFASADTSEVREVGASREICSQAGARQGMGTV